MVEKQSALMELYEEEVGHITVLTLISDNCCQY